MEIWQVEPDTAPLKPASRAAQPAEHKSNEDEKAPQAKTADGKTHKPAGIDFCLISDKYIDGVTHPAGVRLTDAQATGDLDYPLLKPAIVLKAKHVKECELKASVNPYNKMPQFDVVVQLNDLGRAEMHAAFKGVNDDFTRTIGTKAGIRLDGATYLWVINGRAFPVSRYYRPEWTPKTIGEYGKPDGELSTGSFSERNREFGQSFIDALKPDAESKKVHPDD